MLLYFVDQQMRLRCKQLIQPYHLLTRLQGNFGCYLLYLAPAVYAHDRLGIML